MTTWNQGWPGWQDLGRRVIVETNADTGETIAGRLFHEDTARDDDGEFPIFLIDIGGGKWVEFANFDNWRFDG